MRKKLLRVLFSFMFLIGIFSVKVSAANVSYSYANSKMSTNRGYSYLSSTTANDYLQVQHTVTGVSGNKLETKSSANNNKGDGFTSVTTTLTSGYNVTYISGTFKYAGTTKNVVNTFD